MQKLLKQGLSIAIIAILLSSNLTIAEDKGLQLCNDALEFTEEELTGTRSLVNAQEDLLKKMATQRNAAYDRLSSEANTPWYVWTIVGTAMGVIITRGLR